MKKESEKKMVMKTKIEDAIDEVVFEFAKTTFQLIKKYSRFKRLNKVSNSENKKNLKEIANRLNIQNTLIWRQQTENLKRIDEIENSFLTKEIKERLRKELN